MKVTDVKDFDLFFFRPTGILGKIVSWWTGSEYCHVGMVYGSYLLEYREFRGFRSKQWLEVLAEWDYRVDVYRVSTILNPNHRINILNAFYRLKKEYGWCHAILAGLLRRFPRSFLNWESTKNPPQCAEAVCYAFRVGAGIDLVPDKCDWKSTPEDIVCGGLVEKIGSV